MGERTSRKTDWATISCFLSELLASVSRLEAEWATASKTEKVDIALALREAYSGFL